jgi:hypothetical protein
MLWTLENQSFGLVDYQQFLYMDFEMIEILIVCYIGNLNMMNLSL